MSHRIHILNICQNCGSSYERARYPSGRLEQVSQFKRRRFCSHSCAVVKTGAERAAGFWNLVDKSGGPTSCWPWVGAINSGGYGSAAIKGRVITASRHAFELVNGPIPHGEGYHGNVVMHACDNRACCNPAHLSVGTQRQNNDDKIAKGRDWWQRQPSFAVEAN